WYISKSMVEATTAAVVNNLLGDGTDLNERTFTYNWIVPNARQNTPFEPVYATAPTAEHYGAAYELVLQYQRIA
ncbi:hypothetical protein AVEN_217952-1, partial [Araneus ventricosus]